MDIPIPAYRLDFFRNELGLHTEALDALTPWREMLVERGPQMADALYEHIAAIARTRIILDHDTTEERLKSNWQRWFTAIFSGQADDALLHSVWRSGLHHVNHGVDHRFINLAYSLVRRWAHAICRKEIPCEQRADVITAIDILLDVCILVESDAFLAATTRCEHEIIQGVAHQLRNPLMVIGGQTMRLARVAEPGESDSFDAILSEAKRMEQMVKDAALFTDVLAETPDFADVELAGLIETSLGAVQSGLRDGVEVEVALAKGYDRVSTDGRLLGVVLTQALANALEAAKPPQDTDGETTARVTITSGPSPRSSAFVRLVIDNSGESIDPEQVESFFASFHSGRAHGTGLGLPIIRVTARKLLAAVELSPLAPPNGPGTRCELFIPRPGAIDQSGLFVQTDEES